MKVWSIKYIVTKGIEEFYGGEIQYDGEIWSYHDHNGESRFETIGRECFLSHSEALTAAIAAVGKKLRSAEKQIKRLKALEAKLREEAE